MLSRRAAAFEALGDLQAALVDFTTELGKDTYAGTYGEVSIRRASIYLKLGEPEKARDDLTFALGKSFNDQCPQVYRLRAQAERQLGDLGAAQADEEKAAHLPYISSSCVEK